MTAAGPPCLERRWGGLVVGVKWAVSRSKPYDFGFGYIIETARILHRYRHQPSHRCGQGKSVSHPSPASCPECRALTLELSEAQRLDPKSPSIATRTPSAIRITDRQADPASILVSPSPIPSSSLSFVRRPTRPGLERASQWTYSAERNRHSLER